MATKTAAPRFKNVSPLGALDVPALGRVIAEGEEFEVREDLVPLFAAQVSNFEPVNPAAKAAQSEAIAIDEGEETGETDEAGETEGEVIDQ